MVIITGHHGLTTGHGQVQAAACMVQAALTPGQPIPALPGVPKLRTGVSGNGSEAVCQEAVQEHHDQAPATGLLRHDHDQAADSVNND